MPSWSGLFDGILPTGAVAGYRSVTKKKTNLRHVSRLLGKQSMRATKELFITLINGAVGDTAADSYKRIGHTVSPGTALVNGGKRTIETVTTINRATVAGDATTLDDVVADEWALAPASYPVDKSGNGGGGRLKGKVY